MTLQMQAGLTTAAYIDAGRDRPDSLWFFLHVPKTAGSSFREELASRLQPDVNIFITYDDPTVTHDALLDRAMRKFLDPANGA